MVLLVPGRMIRSGSPSSLGAETYRPLEGACLEGYEIHMGETRLDPVVRPFCKLSTLSKGAASAVRPFRAARAFQRPSSISPVSKRPWR